MGARRRSTRQADSARHPARSRRLSIPSSSYPRPGAVGVDMNCTASRSRAELFLAGSFLRLTRPTQHAPALHITLLAAESSVPLAMHIASYAPSLLSQCSFLLRLRHRPAREIGQHVLHLSARVIWIPASQPRAHTRRNSIPAAHCISASEPPNFDLALQEVTAWSSAATMR